MQSWGRDVSFGRVSNARRDSLLVGGLDRGDLLLLLGDTLGQKSPIKVKPVSDRRGM